MPCYVVDAFELNFLFIQTSRYSVKVKLEKQLFLDALHSYNDEWTIGSLASLKQPMIMAVSGPMKQQATQASFKGDSVEEKFHMKAVTAQFIPCIPSPAIPFEKWFTLPQRQWRWKKD